MTPVTSRSYLTMLSAWLERECGGQQQGGGAIGMLSL
jgi:hypothetical protein